MKKELQLLAISVFIALLLISPAIAAVDLDNYPRLDEMTQVQVADEADMIIKAQGGAVETCYDLRSPDNVELLSDLGWSISTNEGYGFHYWGVNCRNVTTPESGKYYDYHGRTPGQEAFFPLNVSQFRYVLHLLIGGEITDNGLSEVFGWTQKRIDTIPAPAAGQWYNSELPPFPYDPAQALDILYSLGIRNDTGPLGWYNTNADIGPVGEIRTIYVLGCPEALESTTAMLYRYQASWNNFFGKKSDTTSDYFDFDLIPWVDMGNIVWMQRDFDIQGSGWRVGRDPDYLFDFFHSSKDGEDDYNLPGIAHDELDELIYAVKYWRWTNGTYITTVEELIDIAWLAEEYLYYLTPYMVTYCEVSTNAFAPGLKSWIESLGYGSDIGATYNWIYWTASPDSIKHTNPGPADSLNPGIASTVYEWEVLSRIYDGLYDIEPFLHKDVMWAMSGYEIDPWVEEGVVEYGQKITVHLRHGIYWHDGDLVTSADVKFNYDFIMNAQFGRYSDILLTYHNTTILDEYNFEIYIKCTGIWTVYSYFGNALIFPQVIWQPWWDNPSGAATWDPWRVDYDDWMLTNYGWVNDTGYLKCLVGTGPWIFHEWDEGAGATHSVANRPGAVWAGNPGYWCGNDGDTDHLEGEFVREDLNFDGIVDIFDATTLAGAAGTDPDHPRWNYGIADITADYIVDIFDAVRLSGHAGWITLPA